MSFYEGNFPVVWQIRDVYVEKIEQLVVLNNRTELSELPDDFEGVTITGYSEVRKGFTPSQGQYSVDYNTGIVVFGGTVPDNTIVSVRYMGRGLTRFPAQRIYIKTDKPDVYRDLQDIFEEAVKGGVMSVQGRTGAVILTPSDIGAVDKAGDVMTGRLLLDGASVDPLVSGIDASQPLERYPLGMSYQAMNNSETGFPSSAGVLMTYNGGANRNFQLFQVKNTQDLYVRTYHDANEWTEWARLWSDKNMGSGSLLDADKLDGKDSTYFEDLISNHSGRTDNPHNVIASQINIEDANNNFAARNVEDALSEEASKRKNHEENTNNPHNVTTAQIGALPASSIACGTNNFSGNSSATVIPHGFGVTPSAVTVTPAEDPSGNLGDVWVTKDATNIRVYNSGIAITSFNWIAIK